MNFKDQIAHDIKNTFINPREFGELADIDGEEKIIVFDNDVVNDRPRLFSTSNRDSYAQGVYQSLITFFIDKDELGYTPVEQQQMKFNGDTCIVTTVSENMGVFEITLESNGV
jgi:hypothetical protein